MTYMAFSQDIGLLGLLSQDSSGTEPTEAKESSSWLALWTPVQSTGKTIATQEGWLIQPCWKAVFHALDPLSSGVPGEGSDNFCG